MKTTGKLFKSIWLTWALSLPMALVSVFFYKPLALGFVLLFVLLTCTILILDMIFDFDIDSPYHTDHL